jgi:2-polyprenyl-3-methyl-5-hydroxy-6-metoxy-1,4-benzoquinol methylase
VAELATGRDSAVLELGCGAGGTGAAALAAGKAGRYVGIEMEPRAAEAARARLTEVIESDVEKVDLSPYAGTFEALIISEVLEHLADPWGVLRTLSACLKPGAKVFASSPNVSHWRVLRSLLSGRFDYDESGVMDRTHLRWFTPASYRGLFEGAGIQVLSVSPLSQPAPRTRFINRVTGNRFAHIFMEQLMVRGIKRS